MYQAYAIRPLASGVLSTPGGLFSGTVSYNTTAVIEFIDEFYPSVGGRFQENYLERFFANRGLIGCSYGPRLAHFPYLEDAGSIYNAIHRFAKTFVYAYYPSPNLISRDSELQSWIVEASGPAKVLDFPASPLLKRETLAGILAQVAYLNGVLHHTINGATPSAITAVLPFHPSAIFAPIPTAKGVTNLLPYLPDFNASITQASYWQNFNRPQLVNSNRDLEEVFSSPEFRTKGPGTITARAALLFRRELLRISDVIEARTFDKNGLAQGMPFIWRCLDPRKIPYFLSV